MVHQYAWQTQQRLHHRRDPEGKRSGQLGCQGVRAGREDAKVGRGVELGRYEAADGKTSFLLLGGGRGGLIGG